MAIGDQTNSGGTTFSGNVTRSRAPRNLRAYDQQRKVQDRERGDSTYIAAITAINKRVEEINKRNPNGIPRIGGPNYIKPSLGMRVSDADLIKINRELKGEEQRVGIKREPQSDNPTAESPINQIPATGSVPDTTKATTEKMVSVAPAIGKYDTKLSPADEVKFQEWKAITAPKDSGADYDLRGAFKAGIAPDQKTGHWPDTFKKPNHPTFSDQSQYATGPDKANAGHWEGEKFVPSAAQQAAAQQQPAAPEQNQQPAAPAPGTPANPPAPAAPAAPVVPVQNLDIPIPDPVIPGQQSAPAAPGQPATPVPGQKPAPAAPVVPVQNGGVPIPPNPVQAPDPNEAARKIANGRTNTAESIGISNSNLLAPPPVPTADQAVPANPNVVPTPLDAIPSNPRNEQNTNTASNPLSGLKRDGAGWYQESDKESTITPGRSDGGKNRIYQTLNANQGMAANYGSDWTTVDAKKFPDATDANAKRMGLPDALAVQRRIVLGGKVDPMPEAPLKPGEMRDIKIGPEGIKGQGVRFKKGVDQERFTNDDAYAKEQVEKGNATFDPGYKPGMVVGTKRGAFEFEKGGPDYRGLQAELLKDPKYGFTQGVGFQTNGVYDPKKEAAFTEDLWKKHREMRAEFNDKKIAEGALNGQDALPASMLLTNNGVPIQTTRQGETANSTLFGPGDQNKQTGKFAEGTVMGTQVDGKIRVKGKNSDDYEHFLKVLGLDTGRSVEALNKTMGEEGVHAVQDENGPVVQGQVKSLTPELLTKFLEENPQYAEEAQKRLKAGQKPEEVKRFLNLEATQNWGDQGKSTVRNPNAAISINKPPTSVFSDLPLNQPPVLVNGSTPAASPFAQGSFPTSLDNVNPSSAVPVPAAPVVPAPANPPANPPAKDVPKSGDVPIPQPEVPVQPAPGEPAPPVEKTSVVASGSTSSVIPKEVSDLFNAPEKKPPTSLSLGQPEPLPLAPKIPPNQTSIVGKTGSDTSTFTPANKPDTGKVPLTLGSSPTTILDQIPQPKIPGDKTGMMQRDAQPAQPAPPSGVTFGPTSLSGSEKHPLPGTQTSLANAGQPAPLPSGPSFGTKVGQTVSSVGDAITQVGKQEAQQQIDSANRNQAVTSSLWNGIKGVGNMFAGFGSDVKKSYTDEELRKAREKAGL